jgi:hypothetical protein
MSDMDNIDVARNNEEFAHDIINDYPDQKNWAVTIRFYSFIHFVDERLKSYDYHSKSHDERKNNIRRCSDISNEAYKIYRFLEDISRDARYECIAMTDEDATQAYEKLEKGKSVLGFPSGGSGQSYKYST